MLFPAEAAVTSLMEHFWRTSSVVARSARISLSEARSLMCRDIQTLVQDPLFGGDVKELQMAAGPPLCAVCRVPVCRVLGPRGVRVESAWNGSCESAVSPRRVRVEPAWGPRGVRVESAWRPRGDREVRVR